VLQIARRTTIVSGAFGIALAIVLADVIESLTIFYTLLGVSLFVPIVAGLYAPRTTSAGALAAIGAGVGGMLAVQVMTAGRGWGLVTPALGGLLASVAAWVISLAVGARLQKAAFTTPA
jgi:SSS family solute:Na+ symporter